MGYLSVEQEKNFVEKANLASNRDHNHGTIIRIYMEQTRYCYS